MKKIFSFLILIPFFFVQAKTHLEGGHLEATIHLDPAGVFFAQTKGLSGYAFINKGKLKSTPIQVDLTSIITGKELRDQHLQDKLLTQKYPVAVLRKIKLSEKGNGIGELEVYGKKIKIKFNFKKREDKQEIEANFILSLKKLGINEISYLGVTVEDEVEILVGIPLHLEGHTNLQKPKRITQ